MSVIYLKDWIATNGAFIAAVLATNATNQLAENPETINTIWITNYSVEYLRASNLFYTNPIYPVPSGMSGKSYEEISNYWATNQNSIPAEHWYATPIPLWAVLLVIAALGIVIGIMMNAVKAIRPW